MHINLSTPPGLFPVFSPFIHKIEECYIYCSEDGEATYMESLWLGDALKISSITDEGRKYVEHFNLRTDNDIYGAFVSCEYFPKEGSEYIKCEVWEGGTLIKAGTHIKVRVECPKSEFHIDKR